MVCAVWCVPRSTVYAQRGQAREDSLLHERLTERSRRPALFFDHHADHEPPAANLGNVGRIQVAQFLHEPVAELEGALWELFIDENP